MPRISTSSPLSHHFSIYRSVDSHSDERRKSPRSEFNAVTQRHRRGLQVPRILSVALLPDDERPATAVLAQRDLDEYKSGELMTSAIGRGDLRARLRLPVQRNMENRKIIMLYAVLNMEATDPRRPAHRYFAERTDSGRRRSKVYSTGSRIRRSRRASFSRSGKDSKRCAVSRLAHGFPPRVGCLLRRLLSMTPGHEPGVPDSA